MQKVKAFTESEMLIDKDCNPQFSHRYRCMWRSRSGFPYIACSINEVSWFTFFASISYSHVLSFFHMPVFSLWPWFITAPLPLPSWVTMQEVVKFQGRSKSFWKSATTESYLVREPMPECWETNKECLQGTLTHIGKHSLFTVKICIYWKSYTQMSPLVNSGLWNIS